MFRPEAVDAWLQVGILGAKQAQQDGFSTQKCWVENVEILWKKILGNIYEHV